MNLNSLMDKIAGRQKERNQMREADYQGLVAQIVEGEEPDADSVERILTKSGKTVDDLRRSVELLERRIKLRVQMDNLQTLSEERKRIEAEIAEADHIYNLADQTHDETIAPLDARLEQIKQHERKANDARLELLETCGDEELVERHREIVKRLTECKRKRDSAETRVRNLRTEADYEREQARLADRKPNVEAHLESAKRCDEEAKNIEKELPDLRRNVTVIEKEESTILDQMLVP